MKALLAFPLAVALYCGAASAQVPAGYPADHQKTVAAAKAEGKVVVYSVLSNKAAAPLVQGFKAMYPGIEVDYDGESGSNEVTDRYLKELGAGKPSADVMWSSAMDLQMKLVHRRAPHHVGRRLACTQLLQERSVTSLEPLSPS